MRQRIHTNTNIHINHCTHIVYIALYPWIWAIWIMFKDTYSANSTELIEPKKNYEHFVSCSSNMRVCVSWMPLYNINYWTNSFWFWSFQAVRPKLLTGSSRNGSEAMRCSHKIIFICIYRNEVGIHQVTLENSTQFKHT